MDENGESHGIGFEDLNAYLEDEVLEEVQKSTERVKVLNPEEKAVLSFFDKRLKIKVKAAA